MTTQDLLRAARQLGRAEGEFVQWLLGQLRYRTDLPSLPQICREASKGLSLRATRPYATGEEAFRIPSRIWRPFSAAGAIAKANVMAPAFIEQLQLVEKSMGPPGSLVRPVTLSTHLVLGLSEGCPYARLLYETSLHPAPQHPLLMRPAALKSSLQASPLVQSIRVRQEMYSKLHHSLLKGSGIPLELFLWGVSRVLSRAISGPQRPLTLVPFFDFMNHAGTEHTCTYDLEDEEADVVVSAVRDIQPGDELTISYGQQRDNHHLFVLYGFTQKRNPVPLSLRIQPGAVVEGLRPFAETQPAEASLLKTQVLEALGCTKGAPPDLVLVGGREGWPMSPGLLASYLVLAADTKELSAWAAAAVASSSSKSRQQQQQQQQREHEEQQRPAGEAAAALADHIIASASRDTWLRTIKALQAAIESQLACYDTPVEQDRRLLEKLEMNISCDPHNTSALMILIEEKELLLNALDRLHHVLERLDVSASEVAVP